MHNEAMSKSIPLRDRLALIRLSGASIGDVHLRTCLAGRSSMHEHEAKLIVATWRKMRTILEPVYGPMPSIEITDLRDKNAK